MKRHKRSDLNQEEALKSIGQIENAFDKHFEDLGLETIDNLKLDGNVKGWVPTSVVPFNWLMGKGYPLSRVVEIYGEEATGKTTLAILGAVGVQTIPLAKGLAVMLDTEQSAAPVRYKHLGLDLSRFYYKESEPTSVMTIEEVFTIIEATVQKMTRDCPDVPIVFIWDSVASTPSKSELDSNYDLSGYPDHARVISRSFRKLIQVLAASNACLICVNQVRSKMNSPIGGFETFGGKAIKFYASIRLCVRKSGHPWADVKGSGDIVGQTILVENTKNKVSTPYRKISLDVFLDDRGFTSPNNMFMWLVQCGVIAQNGAWYEVPDQKEMKSFYAKDWQAYYQAHQAYFDVKIQEILTK